VADELEELARRVVVPSLKGAVSAGSWEGCVEAVVRDTPTEPAVVVGHSGAGPLLPQIASRLSETPQQLVFVDATVPPPSGTAPLIPDEFLASIKDLARGGILPRWSEWFQPETFEDLVPDPDRRAVVLADLPEVPLSFFDGRVPLPRGWSSVKGAFILLSDLYRSEAARAGSFGWPVSELPGAHLDIVIRAGEVADVLVDLPEP
jgi:hypothetical protein